ncbi:MAG: hypothetical protein H6659_03800 [Ardenticatenaceae bacterium]|nr:hypothetical protein [Ardenticatenaceae bacterium]MCB8986384.1 hypothetical protein [Ardenticatenaceae bacterium]
MSRFTPKQIGIIVLTTITALIHLFLGFTSLGDGFFGIVFLLNGLGYLTLLVALYFIPQLADRRPLIRWALLGFTAVTFVLYFVFNWPDVWSVLGIIDKTVELILIILLWLDR